VEVRVKYTQTKLFVKIRNKEHNILKLLGVPCKTWWMVPYECKLFRVT
jgi:hypothetical protein